MMRRLRFVVVVGCAGMLGLAGCDAWHRQNVKSPKTPVTLSDEPTEDPSLERPEELRGFFKPTRNQGTWSSEAREIEKSLGVVN